MILKGKGTVDDFLANWLKEDGLSKTAITMFYYLRSMDSHVVYLDRDHCQECTGFKSVKSLYDGLNELERHGYIKKKNRGVYTLGQLFIQTPMITIVYEDNEKD